MTVTLENLRADAQAREMLQRFDFVVEDADNEVWFDAAPLQPFQVIAQKGSGCVYALTGPEKRVLFVSSEGQAGIVAASLRECLELIVAYPYWQDIVRSAGGDLKKMRKIFREDCEDLEEEALDNDPEIDDYRPLLRQKFGLSEPADPAKQLHHAITVLGANVLVRAPDGHPSEPLFR